MTGGWDDHNWVISASEDIRLDVQYLTTAGSLSAS